MNKNDKNRRVSTFFVVYRLLVLCSYLNSGICDTLKWTSDPTTGILYGIMNSSTLDENMTKQSCEDHNATLPEPKSMRESAFLYRLINHKKTVVLLGLNSKDGGLWRWNSDHSLVTWFNWRPSGARDSSKYQCVVFRSKNKRRSWFDIECGVLSRKKALKKLNKALICQRGSAPEKKWHVNELTGQKYLVLDSTTMIHDEAQQLCEKHGAMLPEPRSHTENHFLMRFMRTYADVFLLGLNDRKEEGRWVWDSDGTPVTLNWWRGAEPNNFGNEDCGVFIWWGWFDMHCGYHPRMMLYKRVLICQQKVSTDCPSGFEENGGFCFMKRTEEKNFTEATAECEEMGAYLVEPRTVEMSNLVKSFEILTFSSRFYIGLTDVTGNGSFVWQSDGELVNYTDWLVGRPKGQDKRNCVVLKKGKVGEVDGWNDVACDLLRPYVCQAPKRKSCTIIIESII